MEPLNELLRRLIGEGQLLQATISGPRAKKLAPDEASKVKVKPVQLRGGLFYQFERTVGAKALHENVDPGEVPDRLTELLASTFKQGLLQAKEADYQILAGKGGGEPTILKKPPAKKEAALSHNRAKRYILTEGEPVPFLVELGVMGANGKVRADKYDKFRQINRFLELIADVVPHLERSGRTLNIIDFGSGKSYLTFAMYHYLKLVQGLDIRITGLDLKADVMEHCGALARRLGYEGLIFRVGDISRYEGAGEGRVDMVVTLHACDTATDAALEKAVRWGADVILSVPCCQHELFGQLSCETLSPMLSHGIIRERFAALATDSVRAHLLELVGYKTQIVEFIDLEHTPKNLLIRAVKQPHKPAYLREMADAYLEFKRFLHADPYLERALQDRLQPALTAAAPGTADA